MAANTVNIALPDPLRAYVEERVAEGDYATPSEFIRSLIREDRERRRERLEAVLLDDDAGLRALLKSSGEHLQRKLSPLCAYTSCRGVSALHICAEFNSVKCAAVLLEAGADVNARADVDAEGLGGQTPLFHAVNSNQNYCRPVMEM